MPRIVQALVIDLKILLEHAMHLCDTFEFLAFSPSCYEQLSASLQEGGARKDAQRVRELVLALVCNGRSSRVQGRLAPVALAPFASNVCLQTEHRRDRNIIRKNLFSGQAWRRQTHKHAHF